MFKYKHIPNAPSDSSIAISFDIEKNLEYIYIGDYDEITNSIKTEVLCENVILYKRTLGSLICDYDELIQPSSKIDILKNDILMCLSENIKVGTSRKAVLPTLEELEEMFITSNNVLLKYLLIIIANIFKDKKHESFTNVRIHLTTTGLQKALEPMYNDFCTLTSTALKPFKNIPPIYENETAFYDSLLNTNALTYFDTDVKIIMKLLDNTRRFYYISKNTIIPCIYIYYDMLKQSKKYIRHCCVCGKAVVLNRANKNVLCDNPECRKKQHYDNTKRNRENQSKFSYERYYSSSYTYWNNRKRHFKDNPQALNKFNEYFSQFKSEAKLKKSKLSPNSTKQEINEFFNWLNQMNNRCDDIIEKIKGE